MHELMCGSSCQPGTVKWDNPIGLLPRLRSEAEATGILPPAHSPVCRARCRRSAEATQDSSRAVWQKPSWPRWSRERQTARQAGGGQRNGDPADHRVRRQTGESARLCGSGRGPHCSTSRACRLTVVVSVSQPVSADWPRKHPALPPKPARRSYFRRLSDSAHRMLRVRRMVEQSPERSSLTGERDAVA